MKGRGKGRPSDPDSDSSAQSANTRRTRFVEPGNHVTPIVSVEGGEEEPWDENEEWYEEEGEEGYQEQY